MKTANGGPNNNVHPLVGTTLTANENIRGGIPARDISSAMAEVVCASERFGFRLHYPLPRSDLLPPYQSFDSTTRGYLQAIAGDPWA